MTTPAAPPTGRPRDASIDNGVLDAALDELSGKGYAAFSIAAVAQAAGTTRPAIYRRWSGKAELIVDAVARLADTAAPQRTGDPRVDLVAELADFAHCISAAGALPLAGLMLSNDVQPDLRAAYLERIVIPRRTRLRAILTEGIDSGVLAADADIDVAGSFLTGSWYAFHVAGRPVPPDWAERVARLVWTACGGHWHTSREAGS